MIQGKTSCGLRYAIRRNASQAAYCALSIHCGTRDEAGYHSGIAHFVEHTIFKGTQKKKASVINSYLDKLGGELNAFTTKEEIVINATVLKEDLPKAAALLFELATSPTFPEHEIQTEKGVVIDEINSYKDSPADEIYDRFEEMLFEGHPLSGPILGTPSSVKKITSEELKAFVREKFTPERMVFTVVADIEETVMEKRVLKMVSDIFPQQTETKDQPALQTEHPVCHFDKTVNRRNHQVNCVLGSYAPSLYQEKERIATILLCNILGGPASNSILNNELREKKGWVYGVECNYTQYADTGVAAIYFGCDKENLDKCLAAIHKAIEKLQDNLLTERKLRAAKKQLLGQLAISSDSGETQCLSMGKSLMSYGEVFSSSQNRELIENVTADDIASMARMIFSREKLSELIYL